MKNTTISKEVVNEYRNFLLFSTRKKKQKILKLCNLKHCAYEILRKMTINEETVVAWPHSVFQNNNVVFFHIFIENIRKITFFSILNLLAIWMTKANIDDHSSIVYIQHQVTSKVEEFTSKKFSWTSPKNRWRSWNN